MVLKRLRTCRECPFRRNSVPGWLGPWTIEKIQAQAHGEFGLSCHTSEDRMLKLHPELEDLLLSGDPKFYEKIHICVGSIYHANASGKLYQNKTLQRFQKRLGLNPNILGLFDFVAHHGKKWR